MQRFKAQLGDVSHVFDGGIDMITCSVCGHLNSPSRATCEECGSDLSDSEDWGAYDDDYWE